MASKKQITLENVGTTYSVATFIGVPDRFYITRLKGQIKSGSGSSLTLRVSERHDPEDPEQIMDEYGPSSEIDERTDILIYADKMKERHPGKVYVAAKVNTGSDTDVVITIEYSLDVEVSGGGTGGGDGGGETYDVFTETEDGLVPAPGVSSGQFLMDDGTWSTPGGSIGPDLSAIEALGGAGFPARISSGNWAIREFLGTTNRIVITNGNGSDDPIINISPVYVGQSSITTVGTITSGTWNGTDIAYTNIQDVSATDRLLGRDSSGSGIIEELTVTGGLEFTGSGGIRRSALSGDVSASAGSNSLSINNDVVTLAKLQDIVSQRIIGRTTTGSGDPELLTVTSPITLVTGSGTVGFDQTVALDNNARVQVYDNGSGVGTRRGINFIPGTGINLIISDNSGSERVDVEIESTGGTLADGNYGDITVSGSGTSWEINAGVVSTVELGGDITAAGIALLDDVDADAQRVTMGAARRTASYILANTPTPEEPNAYIITAGNGISITVDTPNQEVIIDSTGLVADGSYGDIVVTGSGITWTVANDSISNAKLRNSSGLSVIGRSANTTGDPADISTTGSSDAVLRESGGTLGFGTIATAGIANDAVTYAKIQNASVTQRVLGRNTAGGGDYEEVSASQLLDWLGDTRGSILYRGASGWTILTPGSSGDVLTANGAGADPSWQAGGGGGGLTHPQIMSRISLMM